MVLIEGIDELLLCLVTLVSVYFVCIYLALHYKQFLFAILSFAPCLFMILMVQNVYYEFYYLEVLRLLIPLMAILSLIVFLMNIKR